MKEQNAESDMSMKGEETPSYLTGETEMPLGEKDMGGWTMRVYTPEQQSRLHVDEEGKKVEVSKEAQKAESEVQPEPVNKEDPHKADDMMETLRQYIKDMTPHKKKMC